MFSSVIHEHIGPSHRLLSADFSTTGPTERAAGDVMLMSALLPYFDYRFMTVCGIPAITLEGTPEDWEQLRERVRGWDVFGLGWWLEHLGPVLEQFSAAARGNVDAAFWRTMFDVNDLCHREYFGGWVTRLFPYLTGGPDEKGQREVFRNEALGTERERFGYREQCFAFGPGRVPFVWEHRGRRYDMEFIGGLVGVYQAPGTGSLGPAVGWAVRAAAPMTQPEEK